MKPKKEMTRLVKSVEGIVNIDLTGKMPGRGAYVCRDGECVAKARKMKKIERIFGSSDCESIYEALAKAAVKTDEKSTIYGDNTGV
jgi:predicted RNA-binding protein YlxR (DUF448 family)